MAESEHSEPLKGAAGESGGDPDVDEAAAARAANRFDIRRLIGGLFALYGVILAITGAVGSHHIKTQAAGINIDLWAGLAMVLFAIVMLAWAFLRPVMSQAAERRGQDSGRLRRAPAT